MNKKELLGKVKKWATYYKHHLIREDVWVDEDEQVYQQIKELIQKPEIEDEKMNEEIKKYDNILEETRQEVNDLIYKHELFHKGMSDLAHNLLAIDRKIAFFRQGNAIEKARNSASKEEDWNKARDKYSGDREDE